MRVVPDDAPRSLGLKTLAILLIDYRDLSFYVSGRANTHIIPGFLMASMPSSTFSIEPAPPPHHADATGTAFKNPWPSADAPTLAELALQPFPLNWSTPLATLRKNPKARAVKVVKPDWGKAQLEARQLERDRCLVGTWLGHASVLVEMPLEGTEGTALVGGLIADPAGRRKKSVYMLFDPMFSTRSGPTQWTGPRRFNQSPCAVGDLPGCDVVFISHNHYDHLDLGSIEALLQTFPMARYFVPLGNKRWLTQTGVPDELVDELDWWQDRDFYPEDFGHEPQPDATVETRLRVTCLPAQHNSGRAAIDSGSTLWCGWSVEQFVSSKAEGKNNKKKLPPPPHGQSKSSSPQTTMTTTRKCAVYHAGDTGYRRSAKSDVVCPIFAEIGARLGPFDLSFIPIWRGGTLGFVSSFGLRLSHHDVPSTFHGSPADAVAMHRDVKSRNTVGIHFGTFVGSENETYEAVIDFGEACDKQGVRDLDDDDHVQDGHGRAGLLDIGGSLAVEV